MAEKYNGYTNRETWAVSVEYDDYLYQAALEHIQGGFTRDEFAMYVKKHIQWAVLDQLKSPNTYSLAGDFVAQALRNVNYEELVDSAWNEAQDDLAE